MTTPEQVRQYLADKNINSLMKWLTTELVIHKPEDPVLFMHNLTAACLSQDGYKYSTENIEQMIVNARTKSDEQVEQESKLLNRASVTESREMEIRHHDLNQDFSRMVDAITEISKELNPKRAEQVIVEQTCNLLQCDRCIIFAYDADTETMSIIAANSDLDQPSLANAKETKFALNKTGDCILSRCIETMSFEIIDDISQRKDFDLTIYKLLNIAPSNMCCCPVKDFESGEVSGLIQAINKKGSGTPRFDNHDVDLLRALGTIGNIALQNGIIYEMAAAEKVRNAAMLELWSYLHDDTKISNISSLLFTIRRRCLEIVDAEKCTFYFVDTAKKELWSVQGDVNIRMPIDKGMAGLCAITAKVVNEEDVYQSEAFDKASDEKMGFRTRSMLCVPMLARDNQVIGVIQLINKRGVIDVFDENDEKILELVLSAAAPIFEENKLFAIDSTKNMHLKGSPVNDDKYIKDLKTVGPERQRSRGNSFSAKLEDMVINEVEVGHSDDEED